MPLQTTGFLASDRVPGFPSPGRPVPDGRRDRCRHVRIGGRRRVPGDSGQRCHGPGARGLRPDTAQSETVSILSDSGADSLRAAIEAADSAGNHDGHHFSVNGTITLASALPAITNEVIIAGTSAPTYTADGAPVVEINCDGHAGLRFSAGSADFEFWA